MTGLMYRFMLRTLGHNARILERAPDARESRMAGVCLACALAQMDLSSPGDDIGLMEFSTLRAKDCRSSIHKSK